ncbi:hypothetical protein QN277_018323 [Acacia crassicarpa]|uniref:Peptide/nitrate transporter n=1 Tax=Acacia crassicarpa TaxID=499986 RepID=A0AAE1MP61_9FABA|nr:hypothetical protein QN277_018323 [Acacia crassicarpa]
MGQHSATASKNVADSSGTRYFTPLIGGFLADAYLGRYRTIASFSIIYFNGMTLLALSASIPDIKPTCNEEVENCHAIIAFAPTASSLVFPPSELTGLTTPTKLRRIRRALSSTGSISPSTSALSSPLL